MLQVGPTLTAIFVWHNADVTVTTFADHHSRGTSSKAQLLNKQIRNARVPTVMKKYIRRTSHVSRTKPRRNACGTLGAWEAADYHAHWNLVAWLPDSHP